MKNNLQYENVERNTTLLIENEMCETEVLNVEDCETTLLYEKEDSIFNETSLLTEGSNELKMKFMAAVHSDVGIFKKQNQDSLCLKIADTPSGQVAFLVVCDGMGGLKKGDLASATIIRTMSVWFENSLPKIIESGYENEKVKTDWENIIKEQNEIINEYGENNHLQLGTTLTALLVVENNLLIVQVGDSRVYKLSDTIEQLTEDQTVVQRDIKLGLITQEEGKKDPRQNVLLQCIGASSVVVPEFTEGKVSVGDEYLLCSDGFRHKITDSEIYGLLASNIMTNEAIMKKSLVDLVELNKGRKEKDNITAMLLKVI